MNDNFVRGVAGRGWAVLPGQSDLDWWEDGVMDVCRTEGASAGVFRTKGLTGSIASTRTVDQPHVCTLIVFVFLVVSACEFGLY